MIQRKMQKTDNRCSFCDGYGYNLEHHPHCGGSRNDNCSMCPIQVPCMRCKGRGVEVYRKKMLLESTKDIKKNIKRIEDLPF
jgi:RecJ-like exonuclease